MVVPADDAPLADWETFHKRFGVPDDPAEYGLQSDDPAHAELLARIATTARNQHIPKQALQKFADDINQSSASMKEQEEARKKAALAEQVERGQRDLRMRWATDEVYNGNLEYAEQFLATTAFPAELLALEVGGTRLGDNPAVVRWAAENGRRYLSEADLPTPEGAQNDMRSRLADLDKAIRSEGDTIKRQALVEERRAHMAKMLKHKVAIS